MALTHQQSVVDNSTLTGIADAIRAKGGTTASLKTTEMADAITALGEPEYPHPWKNDGKTHIWWWFGPNILYRAFFTAQYVSNGHTFTVDWGDGSTETIAASTSLTNRQLTHVYAQAGEHEVVISGYDEIKISGGDPFGTNTGANGLSNACVRQLELGGNFTGWTSQTSTTGLQCVSWPSGRLTDVPSRMFYSGFMLELVSRIGEVKTFGTDSLSRCVSLRGDISLDSVEFVGSFAFRGCESVLSVGDMPALTELGTQAFSECKKMVSVGDMPELETAEGSSFANSDSLITIGNMPKLTAIASNMFYGCRSLESIGDLSSVSTVGSSAFSNAPSISSLTFRSKTHTEVEAITGFTNFPNRGQSCVFHCSDGDYYRSGSSLLPVPTEG